MTLVVDEETVLVAELSFAHGANVAVAKRDIGAVIVAEPELIDC